MNKIVIVMILLFTTSSFSQFIKFNPSSDSTKTVTLEGYVDVYYGYDLNKPQDANRPYFVSHNRNNEFNVNLAFLSLKYNASRVRATFTPGFGTYMNANYAAEHLSLKNIVEANIGVKLFESRNIWLDAGVMGAPFTTESAISIDQMLYTRSFAAEYSPYYLTGAKLSMPLNNKINLALYVTNGWQIIEDNNNPLAFSSQLEYKPNNKITLQWSTYLGNEKSVSTPNYTNRFFSDFFMVYNPTKKLALSIDTYIGKQKFNYSTASESSANWGQGNINAKYSIDNVNSISARAEYFNDKNSILITPVTGVKGFETYSYSLCYNHVITDNVMFRVESRYFQSPEKVYYNSDMTAVNDSLLIIGGLTAKF